jgi:hypothetical protein
MTDLTLDPGADAAWAAGQWEPCPAFAADGPGSGVCAGCGWLLDDHDHPGKAVIRRLPRAPRSLPSRRLAS